MTTRKDNAPTSNPGEPFEPTVGAREAPTSDRPLELDALGSPDELPVINDRPWMPGLYSDEFRDLARLLSELLNDRDRQVADARAYRSNTSASFRATFNLMENNLLSMPVLMARLAGLPLVRFADLRQDLIPIARAVLPNREHSLLEVFLKCDDPAATLDVVDALLARAAETNSQTIADVADLLLHSTATVYQSDKGFDRLVQRFYEVSLVAEHHTDSLRERIFELAEAQIKLMRLSRGAPASKVLSYHGRLRAPVVEQLADIVEGAQTSWDRIICSSIKAERAKLVEKDGSYAARWTAENGDDDRMGIVPKFRDFERTDQKMSGLVAKVRDEIAELHRILTTDNGDQGSDGSQVTEANAASRKYQLKARPSDRSESDGGEQSESARGTKLPGLQSRSIGKVDGMPNESKPDDDGKSDRSSPRSKLEEPPTLVVLPRLESRSAKEAEEILRPYREKLLTKPVPLMLTPDLAPVRTTLVHMLPHLQTVIDRLLMPMASYGTVTIPPVLLVGQPGCGKTTLAEELARLLALPSITIDGAGMADANVLGVDHRWSTAGAAVHLDLVVQHMLANPCVIIDELEKVGGSTRNGDVQQKLMGLLEPRRAGSFMDTFLSVPVDYSGLNWLFTANSTDGIPAPLLNRLQIIRCPPPKGEHLPSLAPQLLEATYAARGLGQEWCTALSPGEMEALRRHWLGGSIRNLRRLVEAVVDARDVVLHLA